MVAIVLLGICACAPSAPPESTAPVSVKATSCFDNTGRDDVLSGPVKLIPINTPSGTFYVWTKRVGNNPRIKVLLLHGGPGATHEYFEGLVKFIEDVDQGR